MDQVVVVDDDKNDQNTNHQDNEREQEIDQLAGQKQPMDRRRLRILVWSTTLTIVIITGLVVLLPK